MNPSAPERTVGSSLSDVAFGRVQRLLRPAARLACGLLGAGLIGCVLREPPPVDVMELESIERRAAQGTRFERLAALPDPEYYLNPRDRNDPRNYNPSPRVREEVAQGTGTATGEIANVPAATQPATRPTTQSVEELLAEPVDSDVGPTVALPLQEAVRRATLNNFDVAVAGYEPGIAETRVVEALARFDPRLQATVEYQDQQGVRPEQNVFGPTRRLTLGSALVQALPSGGEAELRYEALRNDQDFVFDPTGQVPNPSWTSQLTFQVTQPLLRDFGYDVNRARIYINQNDQRISILDFRQRLEEILLEVEQTYWQLYRAQLEVQIQEDLLQRTLDTAKRLVDRAEQDATRDQISQALASVHQRRSDLVQARTAVAQLSDQLKKLMNDPDLPVTSPVTVLPSSDPVAQPLLFDLESSVATAMLNRPELNQQLLRINNAGRALNVAEANRLPRLDAVFNAGFGGFDEDYPGAVGDQFDLDNVTVGIGLQLEIPLGNREARAILRRARFQREQAITAFQAAVQDVTLEVKQSQRAVSSNFARLALRRKARLAARDAVEQLEQLEVAGEPLTPEFSDRKLRFLEQLAQARSLEAETLAEFNTSIAEYERAKGTLLRYNNVVLERTMQHQERLPVGRDTEDRRR